nr:maleylacetoacetate isomerase [uncultured Halomonas sp.]
MHHQQPILYGYWRSSAAYRARIALNLKGIEVEHRSVHLVHDGGDQHRAEYRQMNPQGLVPFFIDDDGTQVSQSLAIVEYLDETRPDPALLPRTPAIRAQVRSFAQHIASDIHPLNNLRVLQYLGGELGLDDATKRAWYQHWVTLGLAALEPQAAALEGAFSLGERPGLLELCLVPQLYNARRYECDLSAYPFLVALDARAREHEAFRRAAPEVQPDTTP